MNMTANKGNAPNSAAFALEYGTIATISINSQKVFKNCVFSWSKRFDLGSSAVCDIVIDPVCIPPHKELLILPVAFTAFGAGPINVDTYFGTDSDEDGIIWEGVNRNHSSLMMPLSTIRYNPTINNIGTKTPLEFMIPSDGIPATAVLGGQAQDDLISILKCSGKYTFRLTNLEADVAKCVFALTTIELTKGE